MSERRKLEDLNLCDDYLFYEVMSDAEIARKFLEAVLNVNIKEVTYSEGEKTVKSGYTGKAIRLDLYLENVETVYSVEMQSENRGHLPKRARKYGAQIDYKLLKAGEDYVKLKPQIIIFVCAFDLYKEAQYQYTFTNRCHEVNGLEMGDETTKIFLNTKGTKGKISKGLKAFLRYVENSTPENAKALDDPFVNEIAEKVERIKNDEEKRGDFMTFEEIVEWEKEKAIKSATEQAKKEAEAEFEKKLKAKDNALATKLKIKGMSIEEISELTGLSAEEIEQL